MGKKVFLSYANNDAIYANLLVKSLKKKGVDAFAWTEAAAPLGLEWDDVFRKELEESSAFVALISDNWNRSNWAAMEYGAAYALGKKIIPVVIGDINNDNVAIDLNRYPLVNAKNEDLETVAQQVETAL